MVAPENLNKALVFVCILTQVISMAGMVLMMQTYTTLFPAGTTGVLNMMILLIYGFISAVFVTLADIYQPKFWAEHVTVFRYFGGRTLLYIPYGALIYINEANFPNTGYLQFAGGWTWAVAAFFLILAILSVAKIQPAGGRLEPFMAQAAAPM